MTSESRPASSASCVPTDEFVTGSKGTAVCKHGESEPHHFTADDYPCPGLWRCDGPDRPVAKDDSPTEWRMHMRLRHVNYGHGEISEVVEVDFEYDTVTVVSPEGVESEWKIADVREVVE